MCNNFIAACKHTASRNKTGFILYALHSPPLNSRVKNKTSLNFYSTICVITLENIKQNIVEICNLTAKIFNVDFVKPIL